MLKKCTKCGAKKKLNLFSKSITTFDGLQNKCKLCNKKHRTANKESIRLYKQVYYQNNREKLDAKNRAWALKNSKKEKSRYAKYRKNNKEKEQLRHKKYYTENKASISAYHKNYNRKNRSKIEKRVSKRLKTDVVFKLCRRLRDRLRKAIQSNQKCGSAVKDLGCSVPCLKFWLQLQFQDGMTWKNWSFSGWHIDHIVPLASFDLTDRKQFLQACRFSNLQPLWAKENLSKGNR